MSGSTIWRMPRCRSRSLLLALLSISIAACGSGPSGASSGSPGASSPDASAPAETDSAIATEPIDPNLPPKAETGWGEIWSAIPPSYPVPDGAEPAEAADGPVSGAYTVAANVGAPRVIAEFYRDAIEASGIGGTGLDGPLEDGSFTVWSSNGYGCDSLVTILPRGEESLVTVLYGAGCPFA
jgi:hypothetical protein